MCRRSIPRKVQLRVARLLLQSSYSTGGVSNGRSGPVGTTTGKAKHKRRYTNPMTPKQIVLVQESAKMLPAADVAAALFYGRLFELDPSLRDMFHGDMKEQG